MSTRFRPIGNAVSVGIGGPGLVSANEQAVVEERELLATTAHPYTQPRLAMVVRDGNLLRDAT